jgi:hypothetical protein
LENGLVSSPNLITKASSATSNYRSSITKSQPTTNTLTIPDVSTLNVSARRGSSQPQQLPQIPTRSRSRTLPTSGDHHFRPDFVKSNSNNNFLFHEEQTTTSLSDSDDSDDSDKCEIRRGSGPLLDPYGVPVRNKMSYLRNQQQQQQQQQHQSSNIPSSNTILSSPFTTPSSVSPLQQHQQLMGQSDLNQKIRVCVRKRPLNKKELERAEKDIAPTTGVRSINVNEPK